MTKKQYVLQILGPVETFGGFIGWAHFYTVTKALSGPRFAIRFGSKSSARRFAKRVYDVPLKVVPFNV